MAPPAPPAPTAPPATRAWRARIFSVTWLSYFSYYQTRKNVSLVKKELEDLGIASRYDLAGIDTLFLLAYAVGQFVWGFVADVISPRRLLCCGMLATAGLSALFGASDLVALMALAFGLNGLAQSTGWPANSRVMASWFGTAERGVVLGYWGTCYQIGPLVAGTAATYLLVHYGWRAALFGPALWAAVVAIAVYVLVADTPAHVGFAVPDRVDPAASGAALRVARRAAWRALVASPAVWLLGGSYFCIKLMRYSLLFWLPYYFRDGLGYDKSASGYLSTSFELGGVAGVIVAGLVADRLLGRRRIAVAAVGLVLLCGALALYQAIGATSMAANFASMMLVGVLLFGPDSLVSGAAAQDAGGPHAAAAASGFVNGIGSVGAVLQGYVTAYVSEQWGWRALFTVFQGLALCGALALVVARLHARRAASATSSSLRE
jgi:OPA family sugar phosphate sensor protein UhpC-like MFS transporter